MTGDRPMFEEHNPRCPNCINPEELTVFVKEMSDLVHEMQRIRPSLYTKVRFWAALAAAMTYCLGGVLFLGGPKRVSSSAYWVISHFGGHDLWGIMFMTGASFTALCCWKFHRALRWALLLQAVMFSFIAISFAIAAIRYEDANLTAAPIYGWIMVMHVFLSDFARKEF